MTSRNTQRDLLRHSRAKPAFTALRRFAADLLSAELWQCVALTTLPWSPELLAVRIEQDTANKGSVRHG